MLMQLHEVEALGSAEGMRRCRTICLEGYEGGPVKLLDYRHREGGAQENGSGPRALLGRKSRLFRLFTAPGPGVVSGPLRPGPG